MTGATWRERFRPMEFVLIAAVLGGFTGVIVFAVTRQLPLSLVFTGVAFITALLVLAMLALAEGRPDQEDARPLLERHDVAPEDDAKDS